MNFLLKTSATHSVDDTKQLILYKFSENKQCNKHIMFKKLLQIEDKIYLSET